MLFLSFVFIFFVSLPFHYISFLSVHQFGKGGTYANGFKEQIKAINIQRALINEEQRTNDCDYVIPESATAPDSPDGSYVVGEINGNYEKLPA